MELECSLLYRVAECAEELERAKIPNHSEMAKLSMQIRQPLEVPRLRKELSKVTVGGHADPVRKCRVDTLKCLASNKKVSVTSGIFW
eukprot:s2950_g2.t1